MIGTDNISVSRYSTVYYGKQYFTTKISIV